MTSARIAIATDEGFALEGALDAPSAPAAGGAGVVVCHPHPAFGGTMETPLVVALAAGLAAAGLRALRFNFRGIGGSQGRGQGGLVEHEDVAAAVRALAATGTPVAAIVGYSFGALMAARALGRTAAARPLADRLVAIGLPTTIVADDRERVREVTAGLRAARTLLLTGSGDQFSETDRLRAWSRAYPSIELVELPGVGHFFAGAALDDVVARTVAFVTAGAGAREP